MNRLAFHNRDIDGDQYSQLTKTHTKYKLVADALRAVAAKHGLTPRDLQAIAWVSYREKQIKRSDSKAEAKRLFESTMKEAARLAKQLARQ